VTLVRLACPKCGCSPGEFLPGAVIHCGGGNHYTAGANTNRHPLARMVPTDRLPLDDNTKETR